MDDKEETAQKHFNEEPEQVVEMCFDFKPSIENMLYQYQRRVLNEFFWSTNIT